jgi:cAMP phosphodiesterase
MGMPAALLPDMHLRQARPNLSCCPLGVDGQQICVYSRNTTASRRDHTVKVTLVPSSVSLMSGGEQLQHTTSYLINETVAIDAGSLGFYHSASDQARIKHILLSHTHIDHLASLPIFVENAYEGKRDCVTIHGSSVVLDCLRQDVFNDRIWPDFISLSTPEAPFLKLATLEPYRAIELDGLRITPIPVNHVVPTLGFIIEQDDTAIVIPSDTGPTEEIWARANATPHLKAVFLEAAFPNHMAWLANISKHLTPALFASEIQKLNQAVPVIAMHIKARFHDQIVSELNALGMPNVEISRFGQPYLF